MQQPGDENGPKDEPAAAKLEYRNIATADVKVYPVDLMRLYLTRRNLDAIAGIDLAGIKPFHSATIKLGDGQDFDDKVRAIDLPVKREGAYLVMVRGDDRYASGILLVSPLELQVLEEAESGRVRVTVRDATHQGARAEGPGQGDRLRQRGVLLGRDRPAGRLRRRGRPRPGHGRGAEGFEPVRLPPRHDFRRPAPGRPERPGRGQAAATGAPNSPTCDRMSGARIPRTRSGSSSGWRSATRGRTRA